MSRKHVFVDRHYTVTVTSKHLLEQSKSLVSLILALMPYASVYSGQLLLKNVGSASLALKLGTPDLYWL